MAEKKKYKLSWDIKFGKYKAEGFNLKGLIERDSKYVIWCLKNIEWFEIDKAADEYLKEVFENEFNLTVEQYVRAEYRS